MSGPPDISTSDTACYGPCNVVASCSYHHLHGGSWCVSLWRVVLWVALWDRRRPVSVSPNIWHQFSQPCGLTKYHLIHLSTVMLIQSRSLLSTMSLCTGIKCVQHLCIHIHIYTSNCSWQALHHNYLFSYPPAYKKSPALVQVGAADTISSDV